MDCVFGRLCIPSIYNNYNQTGLLLEMETHLVLLHAAQKPSVNADVATFLQLTCILSSTMN